MIRELDTIVHAGETLDRALSSLDREQLKALADRYGLDQNANTRELGVSLRRCLIGLRRTAR